MIAISRAHPESKFSIIVKKSLFAGSQVVMGASRFYFGLFPDDSNPPHGMVRRSGPTALNNELPKGLRKAGNSNEFTTLKSN